MYNSLTILSILVIVIGSIMYSFFAKKDIYKSFITGVMEGFKNSIKLFPYFVSIIVATTILFESHIVQDGLLFLKSSFEWLRFPFELVPLVLMKSISGSASLAITTQLLMDYGPDSFIGRTASILQSSSETTIYVISLYFGYIGIKKIRHTLLVSLLADLVGVLVAFILARIIFS